MLLIYTLYIYNYLNVYIYIYIYTYIDVHIVHVFALDYFSVEVQAMGKPSGPGTQNPGACLAPLLAAVRIPPRRPPGRRAASGEVHKTRSVWKGYPGWPTWVAISSPPYIKAMFPKLPVADCCHLMSSVSRLGHPRKDIRSCWNATRISRTFR